MPTVSGRALVARMRRTHDYMRNHVIPALEPAYAELQRAGKVPAYMTCSDAVYDHISHVKNDRLKSPFFGLGGGKSPEPAEDMCRALSDGRSADLMAVFTTAMDNVAIRAVAREAQSKSDWAKFDGYIRPAFEAEFLHAQDKGYVDPAASFADYWGVIASRNGFYHSPVNHAGAPVVFELPDLIAAYDSGNQSLLTEQIYKVMAADTARNTKHYENHQTETGALKVAAIRILAARTPAAQLQRSEDLETLATAHDRLQRLQAPTLVNRLRQHFDMEAARTGILKSARTAHMRLKMLPDDAPATAEGIAEILSNPDTFTADKMIADRAAYCYQRLMQISSSEGFKPTADDILRVAERDYTLRAFPLFDTYKKERPAMALRQKIDASQISARKPDTVHVTALTVKGANT